MKEHLSNLSHPHKQVCDDDEAFDDHGSLWRFLGHGPFSALKLAQEAILLSARVALIRMRTRLCDPEIHRARVSPSQDPLRDLGGDRRVGWMRPWGGWGGVPWDPICSKGGGRGIVQEMKGGELGFVAGEVVSVCASIMSLFWV